MHEDWIGIGNDRLVARINPLGAELSSLRDGNGYKLMTNGDPAFWSGRAPLLFPIVGRLAGDRYRHEGREYSLPQHGFARRMPFAVIAHDATEARFRLTDDAATRASYPFAFQLDVAFTIDGYTLAIAAEVTNTGATEMPASFGFHPAFAWPLPYGFDRAAHRVVFEAAEGDVSRLAADGTLAPGTRPSPLDGRRLPLADALFAEGALIWPQVASRSLRYGADDGPEIEIAYPGMGMLGIWTKPGARFVCLEPWQGHADPQGFAGELRDKPGMLRLAPGETQRFAMAITLRP